MAPMSGGRAVVVFPSEPLSGWCPRYHHPLVDPAGADFNNFGTIFHLLRRCVGVGLNFPVLPFLKRPDIGEIIEYPNQLFAC